MVEMSKKIFINAVSELYKEDVILVASVSIPMNNLMYTVVLKESHHGK